ncbi:maleylpyruvate isomerase family mycothiol-dependent enzyme [Mycobacterium sp. Root265]|uniref:maleylpyruvate isomerase family mycothiol-dependent enzyme n=1 Tax=Mycobacterium sp. Root265 TaxID=1736504 RepID=UPI001F43FE48|nr:maleylpyruvate isomerase family mycothiol-dependent enzyme [Mycobacterium sp. Root265]
MSAAEMLRHNDVRLLGVMAGFTAAEWAASSLCEDWTNHQLLAHLVVGYSAAPSAFVAEILHHQGSFDTANTALACRLADTRAPGELLDDMDRLRSRPRGLGRVFPKQLLLGDHITHELDMLYALGRTPDIAPDPLIAVLRTQVALPNPFVPAYRNSRGLRLVATDADWNHGLPEHPDVRGPAAALVSVLGNRSAALPQLTGRGVQILRSRHVPLP